MSLIADLLQYPQFRGVLCEKVRVEQLPSGQTYSSLMLLVDLDSVVNHFAAQRDPLVVLEKFFRGIIAKVKVTELGVKFFFSGVASQQQRQAAAAAVAHQRGFHYPPSRHSGGTNFSHHHHNNLRVDLVIAAQWLLRDVVEHEKAYVSYIPCTYPAWIAAYQYSQRPQAFNGSSTSVSADRLLLCSKCPDALASGAEVCVNVTEYFLEVDKEPEVINLSLLMQLTPGFDAASHLRVILGVDAVARWLRADVFIPKAEQSEGGKTLASISALSQQGGYSSLVKLQRIADVCGKEPFLTEGTLAELFPSLKSHEQQVYAARVGNAVIDKVSNGVCAWWWDGGKCDASGDLVETVRSAKIGPWVLTLLDTMEWRTVGVDYGDVTAADDNASPEEVSSTVSSLTKEWTQWLAFWKIEAFAVQREAVLDAIADHQVKSFRGAVVVVRSDDGRHACTCATSCGIGIGNPSSSNSSSHVSPRKPFWTRVNGGASSPSAWPKLSPVDVPRHVVLQEILRVRIPSESAGASNVRDFVVPLHIVEEVEAPRALQPPILFSLLLVVATGRLHEWQWNALLSCCVMEPGSEIPDHGFLRKSCSVEGLAAAWLAFLEAFVHITRVNECYNGVLWNPLSISVAKGSDQTQQCSLPPSGAWQSLVSRFGDDGEELGHTASTMVSSVLSTAELYARETTSCYVFTTTADAPQLLTYHAVLKKLVRRVSEFSGPV